jgi:hypothetical protein
MVGSRIKVIRFRDGYAFGGQVCMAMVRMMAVLLAIRQLAVLPGLRRGKPRRAAGRHAGQARSRMRRSRQSPPRHAAA